MDWLPYAPPAEEQVSDPVISQMRADTLGCLSFSAVHCIESQEIKRYGKTNEYSERALTVLSGTNDQGNTVTNVINAIKKYGLILEKDWPTPKTFTHDQFFAPIPQSVLDKAIKIDFDLIINPTDNNEAPYWTLLDLGGGVDHMVEELNPNQYFDSYQKYIKNYADYPLIKVLHHHQLILKSNTMNSYVKTMNYNGTIGVFIPVSNPAQVPVLNNLFNVGIQVNPDGTIPTDVTVIDK